MTAKSVYVSYSWTAERETPLVDELGYVCKRHGLELRRDKDRLKHRDLIRTFMDELASSGDIITIFSRSYFESEYCMYELLQISKNGNFHNRIHPIQLNNIALNSPEFQLELVDYWENKTKKLQIEISKRNPSDIIPIIERSAIFASIYQQINQLVSFVSSMLINPLVELRSQGFEPLFRNIDIRNFDENEVIKKLYHEKNIYNLDLEKNKLKDKERESEINQTSISIQDLESKLNHEHKKLQKWLSDNRDVHADKIHEILVEDDGELITRRKSLATELEVDEFKMTFTHFIDDLILFLLDADSSSRSEPFINKTFSRNVYKKALSIFLNRIPSWVSGSSKEKLTEYVEYLIERI
jgi:hypothetical protein